MQELVVKAEIRSFKTKGERNKARKMGKIPGIYYASNETPIQIMTTEKYLKPLVYTTESHVVRLEIDGVPAKKCVLKDVQFDPVTDKIIHFDLQGLVGGKVELEVPVVLKGTAIGEKDGGIIEHMLHKVKVICPSDRIPEHIECDITNLKIGDALHVKDLKVDNDLVIHHASDAVVVAIVPPKGYVAAEAKASEEETKEPEVIKKGKAQEKEKEKEA